MRIFRFIMALRTLVTSIFHTLKSLFWALILLLIIVHLSALGVRAEKVVALKSEANMAPKGSLYNPRINLSFSFVCGRRCIIKYV